MRVFIPVFIVAILVLGGLSLALLASRSQQAPKDKAKEAELRRLKEAVAEHEHFLGELRNAAFNNMEIDPFARIVADDIIKFDRELSRWELDGGTPPSKRREVGR